MALEQVRHRLINPVGGDPGIYIELVGLRRGIIFDLGENRLKAGELLRARDLCISHTHIDHWIGFDRMLRCWLGKDRELRIYGPVGMADYVWHRIHGYVWNLTFEDNLRIVVHELHDERIRRVEYSVEDRFQGRKELGEAAAKGPLFSGPGFRVEHALLDHSTPCLGYAFVEEARFSFDPQRLEEADIEAGPELASLKQRFLAGEDADLAASLGSFQPERRIAYVTDTGFSEHSLGAVLKLARGAEVLYCEATYPDEQFEKAAAVQHLTGGQCGAFARAASVSSLVPFHFSRAHSSDPSAILADVGAGQRGEVDWVARLSAAGTPQDRGEQQ